MMSGHEELRQLADIFGVLPHYFDVDGHDRFTSDETREAFLAANGVDVSSSSTIADALHSHNRAVEDRWFPTEVIVEALQPQDMQFGLAAAWQITRWDDPTIQVEGQAGDFITLPPLPPDVYNLRIEVAGRVEHVRVLATPRQLPLLSDLLPNQKIWGMTAALYGLQSERSTGVGDFEDLGAFCGVVAGARGGFVGINPVHNMGFANTEAISPYSPSHRGFLNTDHIALDSIPGLQTSKTAGKVIADAKLTFDPIKAIERIDYAAQKQSHRALLETLYSVFLQEGTKNARADYASYLDEHGAGLVRFARFEALSEVLGDDWRQWPENAQEEEGAPLRAREGFHSWLQWIADCQLGRAQASARDAGMPLGLYLDLSVGSRRDGAESWCEQDAIATGVSIGAPPDHLGPDGQNWNLAAFSPQKLQAAGYAPLRQVLAQTMRHAGVIRIDHVLGLNRSFWIPDDGSPGAYIRQPFESLLAIIKIEAYRAQTVVIGEDLGLVPDGFRETMQSHGFYGYSVLQYEKEHDGGFRNPAHGAGQMLSCFGTHDTPTIRGFETARDIDWWQKLGSLDESRATHLREVRRNEVASLKALAPDENADLVQAIHATLAGSASDMICLQLDDVLAQVEAQNLPGTIEQHPNWRRRHGVAVDKLAENTGMARLGQIMQTHGRSFGTTVERETPNDK